MDRPDRGPSGPERTLILFGAFSVIAAGWLLLGYWLARRPNVMPPAKPLFPTTAPLAGLADSADDAEADAVISTTGYVSLIAGQASAELIGRGPKNSTRRVIISSDQTIRVGKTVTSNSGLIIPANMPVALPYALSPQDTLRVVRASGTNANVSASVKTTWSRDYEPLF